MVPDTCVKFGVQKKSGSPDTGSKGAKNGAFRLYLQRISSDASKFGVERGSYGTRYVSKVWSPGKIRFSRYGVQRGPKWSFSRAFRKVCIRFQLLSGWKKLLLYLICL